MTSRPTLIFRRRLLFCRSAMNVLNPDSQTVLIYIRWMVFIATGLTWAAFILLHRCRSCDTGGRTLVLAWLFHAGLWLGINSTLRLVFGYSAPTTLMSMWGAVLYIQAALSVIAYIILWNRATRYHRSSTSSLESPSPSER